MLVQCPSCKTKYKVSDDVVKDTTPAFRCSRCKHTFELELELPRYSQRVQRENHLPEFPAALSRHEPELNLSFPEESRDPENKQDIGEKHEVETAPILTATPVSGDSNSKDRWSIGSEATPDETFVIAKPAETPPQREPLSRPLEPAEETPGAVSADEPDTQLATSVHAADTIREQRASTVPFFTLFGVLIVVFAFATAYYAVHPQDSEGIVQQIPVIGASVLKNDHLRKNIELKSVQTSYQTIQGNREVFVVTGLALNKNPVVIHDVRIAGELYSPEGKAIEQQTVWIGNAISLKIVRGMTAQDISDLQRLKPLKSFEIPPGDSVPFTIVFLKPPRDAKDFSCQIVSAEADA